jgi:hypothetical protein
LEIDNWGTLSHIGSAMSTIKAFETVSKKDEGSAQGYSVCAAACSILVV